MILPLCLPAKYPRLYLEGDSPSSGLFWKIKILKVLGKPKVISLKFTITFSYSINYRLAKVHHKYSWCLSMTLLLRSYSFRYCDWCIPTHKFSGYIRPSPIVGGVVGKVIIVDKLVQSWNEPIILLKGSVLICFLLTFNVIDVNVHFGMHNY